jgi:hypothetical protein
MRLAVGLGVLEVEVNEDVNSKEGLYRAVGYTTLVED